MSATEHEQWRKFLRPASDENAYTLKNVTWTLTWVQDT